MQSSSLTVKVVQQLFVRFSNFRSVLIKNVQQPKNQLHDVAKIVKRQLVALLEQLKEKPTEESKALCMVLVKSLFGPNSLTHFSPKKNQDLLFPISAQLDSDQVTEYIEYLSNVIAKPDLNEFYPHDQVSSPEKDDLELQVQIKESVKQKKMSCRLHGLQQAASVTLMFKDSDGLTTQHIMMSLNLLCKASFTSGDNLEYHKNAQFKLFGLIG